MRVMAFINVASISATFRLALTYGWRVDTTPKVTKSTMATKDCIRVSLGKKALTPMMVSFLPRSTHIHR